jgi:hypothetical protein
MVAGAQLLSLAACPAGGLPRGNPAIGGFVLRAYQSETGGDRHMALGTLGATVLWP